MTEQEIKSFVMVQKNVLFASSLNDAEALCSHYILICTAKFHFQVLRGGT
ncbi:hypothetical protein [Microbulbifer sp. JMSA008]